MKVDLRLAVNYVPACACLVRLGVLLLALTAAGGDAHWCLLVAAGLYMDRLVCRNQIFDASSILLAVFFADAHGEVRATSHRAGLGLLVGGLHACWAGACCLLIAEPPRVRQLLRCVEQLGPPALMVFVVCATAFLHAEVEPPGLRCLRAVAFAMLCFVWIYLVGVESQHGLEHLKENSAQFLSRMAPVLYSPAWVALAFVPAACGALAYHHLRRPEAEPEVPYEPDEPEIDQMQEMLRAAKMSACRAA